MPRKRVRQDWVDGDQVATHLEVLFRGTRGLIEVRPIDPETGRVVDRTFHWKRQSAATAILEQASKGRNVYVGTARRRSRGSGGKENVRGVRVLWVDIDFRRDGDEKVLRERLADFPLPPTIVIHSGGGLHAYWRLSETVRLESEADRSRFERALKGLAEEVGGDPAVTDCSRVMRVAGTKNQLTPAKRDSGRRPAPAQIEDAEFHREYSFEDLDRFSLLDDPEPSTTNPLPMRRPPSPSG